YALNTSEPVVISTRTKTLQEQLVDKDIPFLKSALNVPIDYVMVKGRENYLCMNKLAYVFARIIQEKNQEDMVGVLSIMLWLLTSENGDFSEIHNSLVTRFKNQVYSDSHSCLGNKCPFKTICFLNRIKKRAKSAHILVVNHALLFSDVFYEANILPDYHHLVIDEAHAIEDIATQCFSRTLSRKRIHEVAVKLVEQRLWEGKNPYAPLVANKLRSLQVTSRAWLELNMEFFEKIESIFMEKEKENYFFKKSQKKLSFKQLALAEQTLLEGLMEEMDRLLGEISLMLEDAGYEVKTHITKVQYAFYRKIQLEVLYIREDLKFLRQKNENTVRWVDAIEMKRSRYFELKAVPIEVGTDLQKYVFNAKRSVMFTSATLSVKNNFNYFLSRIGYLETDRKVETFSLSSPFDLEKSILLCAPQDAPIFEDTKEYVQKLSEYIENILLTTQGKALVLFTSHKHLNDVFFQVKDSLQRHKIPVYCQGRKVSDRNIIKQFRENVNSVLMGTDSFWEGLDVPGESLSHVIIVKLPFDVPTDPIVMARMEQVGLKGKSSFFDYVIPNAVTRFKQGFGRLIRSKTDKGSVIILDRRVLTQGYGKSFLQSVVANRQFPPNVDALRNLLTEWF
ncbi:MAG: helicase C-terminal domain-containing protein, partial [Candidatus Margulisiibacteriota bacterium]